MPTLIEVPIRRTFENDIDIIPTDITFRLLEDGEYRFEEGTEFVEIPDTDPSWNDPDYEDLPNQHSVGLSNLAELMGIPEFYARYILAVNFKFPIDIHIRPKRLVFCEISDTAKPYTTIGPDYVSMDIRLYGATYSTELLVERLLKEAETFIDLSVWTSEIPQLG